MPDDKRVDLSGDLSKMGGDLLKDVQAATEQVKKRKADDRAKEAADAKRSESRKISAVLVAIGAVVVLLLSYWVVFARQGEDGGPGSGGPSMATAQSARTNAPIKPPCVTNCAPTAPPAVGPPVGRDSQSVQHPPDEYEQPSSDQGM